MFSIIVTVYNAENTILNTIKKLIESSRGQLYEIIIVNDGSTDRTINILKQFENNNSIKVINQSNGGVGKARNTGIKNVSSHSEYITFVDDSDYLSDHFILESQNFFKKYKNLNIAVAPIKICKNGETYEHSLSYRFNSDKDYVDILTDFKCVHFHIGGVVFRTKLLSKGDIKFNESVCYWEDAYLINTIFLKEQKYGLIKNAFYYYDRNNEESLSHVAWVKDIRYTYQIKEHYLPLINKSISEYGYVIKYIQYLIALHYLEYLREHNQKFIDKMKNHINDEFKYYSNELLEYIDFEVIDSLNCPVRCKAYMCKLKRKAYPYSKNYNDIKLYIHNYKHRKMCFSFSDDIGTLNKSTRISIFYRKKFVTTAIEKKCREVTILGEKVNDISLNIFEAEIPLKLLLFGCQIKVEDTDKHVEIWVKNKPMIFRLLNRILRKGEKQ
nr:glycosyltransferase family 2 protein [Mammaliicoccus sp. Marseille-Q6498]